MRRLTTAIGTAAAAAALAATAVATGAFAGNNDHQVKTSGDFVRYPLPDGSPNPVLAGARARVHAVYPGSGKSIVTLVVDGLAPNRAFGAHVHQKACSPTDPAASGGHYQNVPGTATAANEVWLDFTTDAQGHGEAKAKVDWQFVVDTAHPTGAGSVVVHRDVTSPTGSAGPRVACLTVPFAG